MSLANIQIESLDEQSEDSLFSQLIEDDPNICNRCYRRTHDELEYSELYQELYPVGRAARWRVPPAERVFPPSISSPYMDVPDSWRSANQEGTACECGSIDDHTRDGPLATSKALELASRISDRLDEIGVDHDRELLLEDVEDGKRDSELTGRDETIFARAVERAVGRT